MIAALPAVLPSPTRSVWHLGPFPVRAYALCIIVGIIVAVVLGERRVRARGGRPGVVSDIALWAVPFGIVGGRLYHVITTPQPYFGEGGHPWHAFEVWKGGLGVWGAIALGGVGAWIACRRAGLALPPVADALAPGIVLAQAIGRWGNWFNNELYGRTTDLPWGLRIYDWDADAGVAVRDSAGHPFVLGIYHPTFLYESLWCVGVAVLIIWAERRFQLGHGRVFGLYVVAYTAGRAWIEALRIDDVNHILGLRLNLWTSGAVLVAGIAFLVLSARWRPGREMTVLRQGDGAQGQDKTQGQDKAQEPADTAATETARTNTNTTVKSPPRDADQEDVATEHLT